MKINLSVECRPGGYVLVTSDDVPGMFLCSKRLDNLFADVPYAIKHLLKHNLKAEWPEDVTWQDIVDREKVLQAEGHDTLSNILRDTPEAGNG